MSERIYKTMKRTGGLSTALGIAVVTVGLAAGIGGIISGAVLLKRKSEITF